MPKNALFCLVVVTCWRRHSIRRSRKFSSGITLGHVTFG